MDRIEICNFHEFHDAISGRDYHKTIYRGVSKVAYTLIPKLGRETNHRYAEVYEYESAIIKQFQRWATPHLIKSPSNAWEWIAIAQHHGLPTRLLDWTRNPMVALFFSIQSEYDCDSVVYVLNSEQFNSNIQFDDFAPSDCTEVMLFEPSHINPRIIAQNGLFTVHDNVTQPLDSTDGLEIVQVVIKAACKKQLKRELNTYGVNKATLFPGMDGIADYLCWLSTKE